MALRKEELNSGERYNLSMNFGIAQDEPQPDDLEDRLLLQRKLRDSTYKLALDMRENIESSVELHRALLKLEEALMWSGKAIFKD